MRLTVLFLMLIVCVSPVFSETPGVSAPKPADPFQDSIDKLKDQDPDIRRAAARKLLMLRKPEAAPYLIQALNDRESPVRVMAAEALGTLRAKSALGKLSSLLESDGEPQVRQSAAIALGYIGEKSASGALIKGLADSHRGTRFACAQTLGILRSTEAVPALIGLLEDKNHNMRRSAVNTLGEIAHESARQAVHAALSDKNEDVRMEAAKVAGILKNSDSTEKLREMLGEKNPKITVNAAKSLALMGDTSGLAVSKKILETEKDMPVRAAAIDAIGLAGDRTYILSLRKISEGEDKYLADRAKAAMYKINARYPVKKQKKTR